MHVSWCLFRCGIPVVLMGESGSGKTRLIRFMCDLIAQGSGAQNMLILKVECMYECMYVHTLHVHTCVHKYVCMYKCMYVHMCMFTN